MEDRRYSEDAIMTTRDDEARLVPEFLMFQLTELLHDSFVMKLRKLLVLQYTIIIDLTPIIMAQIGPADWTQLMCLEVARLRGRTMIQVHHSEAVSKYRKRVVGGHRAIAPSRSLCKMSECVPSRSFASTS